MGAEDADIKGKTADKTHVAGIGFMALRKSKPLGGNFSDGLYLAGVDDLPIADDVCSPPCADSRGW